MGLSGMLGSLLQQYTGGAAADHGVADQHFDQVTQGMDHSSLASAISGMLRSSETPAFGQMTGQVFQNGNPDQKASMLNTMLAGAAPLVLSQLAHLIPGLGAGGTVSTAQAEAIPPSVVTEIAAQAEQHDPSIIDKMSSIYAAHPTLVKTLGTGAMIVALREMAKKFTPQA
ncbi:MAG: hypothetical protein ABI824_08070 [Acidobacteriota bacterium]